MRRWSSKVGDVDARTQHNDTTAEFEIRNIKPPYDVVKADIDRLCGAVVALFDGLSEERKAKINDEMMADYVDAQKRSN